MKKKLSLFLLILKKKKKKRKKERKKENSKYENVSEKPNRFLGSTTQSRAENIQIITYIA